MSGKCPKCEALIKEAIGTRMDIQTGNKNIRGLGAKCPNCGTVLGVSVDPFSLRSETVNYIISELRKQ